jgi:hypothetical protein
MEADVGPISMVARTEASDVKLLLPQVMAPVPPVFVLAYVCICTCNVPPAQTGSLNTLLLLLLTQVAHGCLEPVYANEAAGQLLVRIRCNLPHMCHS